MIPIYLSPSEVIYSPERTPEPIERIEEEVTHFSKDATELGFESIPKALIS